MDTDLEIQRLGWAGIQLSCEGQSIVIDLFEDRYAFRPFMDEVSGPLPGPAGQVDAALVTHLHADHTDPAAIGRALKEGGQVFRPGSAVGDDSDRASTAMAEAGLATLEAEVLVVECWKQYEAGPFVVTPVPAVDGFGDPQTSWVVEAGGRRILHAGDTLFHGYWWPIASRFGRFDAAFLPINAPVCDFPHRQPPSPFPVVMGPGQAAVAARMLDAEIAVPIHYEAINEPGLYEPAADPVAAFREEAAVNDTAAQIVEVGDFLRWPTDDPAADRL